MAKAVTDEFPLAKYQSCWTHILGNVASKVRAKDKVENFENLKEVYQKETADAALKILKIFFGKWRKKYSKVKKSLEGKENHFAFMDFPDSIKARIYINNIFENFKNI